MKDIDLSSNTFMGWLLLIAGIVILLSGIFLRHKDRTIRGALISIVGFGYILVVMHHNIGSLLMIGSGVILIILWMIRANSALTK